jgi:hypothetical protein
MYNSCIEVCVRHLSVSMVMKVSPVYAFDGDSMLAYRKGLYYR